jgi:hypothetical protein
MSANIYTIENLLVGTQYYSRTLTGEIISAEKHPACLHYDGAEAYLVEISKPYGGYAYRTVAVKSD